MKYKILIFSIILGLSTRVFAQNTIDSILVEIEKNNTSLSAFKKQMEAEKIGNSTGIYLQNPEVEFNYLWGNPSSIGNRKDFSIRQTFDFPSAYAYKNQISALKNEQAELEYQKQRKSILLQTRILCSDLIYINALGAELTTRMQNAQSIANSFKSKFDVGEANILDYNKAQINLLNITKDVEVNEIERKALLAELANLNGGVFIEFTDKHLPITFIAPDFEQWYLQAEQNNPVLHWLKQEIVISQKQEKLNTALSLPKFSTGYMSEKVVGQQFQGIKVGVSISLWENKNTGKYHKAKTLAIQGAEYDAKLQFYNQLKAQHAKVTSLQNSVTDYRKNVLIYSNAEILRKALEKGEISLAEYILELSVYYESINRILEMERDMNKAVAEINQYQ